MHSRFDLFTILLSRERTTLVVLAREATSRMAPSCYLSAGPNLEATYRSRFNFGSFIPKARFPQKTPQYGRYYRIDFSLPRAYNTDYRMREKPQVDTCRFGSYIPV
jgi:hypothetical protein